MKKLMIIIAALSMVATFVLTASAAEWNFYGSARVSTFYTSIDDNVSGTPDVDNYVQGLQGNARIGARVKVSDELTGRFEYGSGVNLRILYGEWNFGAGSFLVGQTYSPLNMFYSNQVFGSDNGLLAEGGVYSGREAMLRLKFGNFQIAAIPPKTAGIVIGAADGANTLVAADAGAIAFLAPNLETDDFSTVETSFPAFEAKYTMKFDMVSLALAGGYQTFELKNAAGVNVDVDSYVLALGGKANFGMAYVGANIYTGQNPGYLIAIDASGAGFNSGGLASISGSTVLDNDATGYLVVLGAKFTDMISAEIGYAGVSTDLDLSTTDDDSNSYYAQATITLAPGVFFVPEVGVIDYDEQQSDMTYFGAKWQINF